MGPIERAYGFDPGASDVDPDDDDAIPTYPAPTAVPDAEPDAPPQPLGAEVLTRLNSEAVDPADLEAAGPATLSRLLAVETRPDRFQRLLRTWIGKINEAVQMGDIEGVVRWMDVVLGDLEVEDELAQSRDNAVGELTSPVFLEATVVALVDRADADLAAAVLKGLGSRAIDTLVEWMAIDDPPVSRRHIVGLLAMAGRFDVRSLALRLNDERWFIVRNVAISLGKTGRPQAVEPLLSAVDHNDDRVRVEVLRALSALQGDEAVYLLLEALGDSSRRVRQAVVSLLRASPSRLIVGGLVDVIESGIVGSEEAAGLVDLIAERRDDDVVPSLERLAEGRFAIGARRAARDAARKALIKRAS